MTKYEKMHGKMQEIPAVPAGSIAVTYALRQALSTVPEMPEAIALRARIAQAAAKAAEKVAERMKLSRAWRKYEALVRKMTNAQDLSSISNIHLRAWRKYDLDHIISISEGFKMGLPATTLASISNLRIIPHLENTRKGATSDFKAHPLGGLIRA